MKQGGECRRNFFRSEIRKQSIGGLTFLWFVTHDQNNKIIPALAETELLQAHFDEFDCLPELNLCA
jgi:hypothetical protein